MITTTILPENDDDWDRSAWSIWSCDFSDVTEIGPSSYDFVRIWQNDPVSDYTAGASSSSGSAISWRSTHVDLPKRMKPRRKTPFNHQTLSSFDGSWISPAKLRWRSWETLMRGIFYLVMSHCCKDVLMALASSSQTRDNQYCAVSLVSPTKGLKRFLWRQVEQDPRLEKFLIFWILIERSALRCTSRSRTIIIMNSMVVSVRMCLHYNPEAPCKDFGINITAQAIT